MALRRLRSSSVSKKINTDFSQESDFLSTPIAEGQSRKTSRGVRWQAIRGAWSKDASNNATSTTSSASFPITVVDALSPNVSITLNDIGNGTGASIWVTDSGNWWGTGVYQQPESCNCSQYQYQCNCSNYPYECNCSVCSTTTCAQCPREECDICSTTTCDTCYSYTCVATGCNGGYGCNEYGVTGYSFCGTADRPRRCPNYGCTGYGCRGFGCTQYRFSERECRCVTTYRQCRCVSYTIDCDPCTTSSYFCNCSTCTGTSCETCIGTSCETCYPQYVRLIQSVANTVATVATWSFSSIIKSLKIKTLGKQITVEAFSDADAQTRIGNAVAHTAPTAEPTTKFGLIISPSAYAESKKASKINIERNKQ